MKIRKSLAGVAAGALAVTGIAVVTAPAADAYSGSETIRCRLYFSDTGVGSSPSSWTETISLTQSPANPNAGDNVTVTVSSTGGGNNGPIAVNANTLRLAVNLVGTGAAPATVATQSSAVGVGSYPATNIAAGAALGGWTTTGTYTATGNGAGSLALGQIKFDAIATDSNNVDTYCSDSASDIDHKASPVTSTSAVQAFTITGPNGTIASSSGQNAGVQAARFSPAYTTVVAVTGTVWTPNVSSGITAQFCADAAGTSCVNPGFSAVNSLTTDASGNLSGAITHAPGTPGPTTGNRYIVINDGTATGAIPVLVLGSATVSVSPASFGPGATVAVSGSNFNPGQAVTAYGSSLQAVPFTATTDPSASLGNASATGAFSGTYQVNAANTASIVAYQGIPGAPTASNPSDWENVVINQDTCTRQVGTNPATTCETKQNVNAVINAGALTQTAGDFDGAGSVYTTTSIDFGAVTSSVSSQVVNRSLNPLTVADARGGSVGWSLTAAMPNLVNTATGTIANSNMAVSGQSCVANAAGDPGISATGNTAGTAGNFGSTVTLCTKNTTADSAGDTSGGQYLVNANLALTVPAFQQTGTYASTITVTLT